MSNPFDSHSAHFYVLVNNEGQYSLWPEFAQIPAGWQRRLGPEPRQVCVDYINAHWLDMRPLTLLSADKE